MTVKPLRVGSVPVLLCSLFSLVLTGTALATTGSSFTLASSVPKTLTPAALAAAQKTQTQGHVSSDSKTLTFTQKAVRLVAVTGPDNDMLSYRIDGLRNPSLVVPRGATLKLLFVNTDDAMFHNIRFGAPQKVYPNLMTTYMKRSVGTPELPHKIETVLHGEELTLRAPATTGTYAYLCTVRGHARGSMVGKVIVK